MKIQDVSLKAVQAMIDAGYTPFSAWNEYESIYAPIIRLHNKYGKNEISEEVFSEYIKHSENRYKAENIVYGTYRRLTSGAERLLTFSKSERIGRPHHGKRINIGGYYGDLLTFFSEKCDLFSKTNKPLALSDLRQHFQWLQVNGIRNINSVNSKNIRDYLVYCANKYQAQTLSLLKNRLKHSYAFFAAKGYVDENFNEIFSFKVKIPKRIKPAVSQKDIASILTQIDRSSPRGKRDYAILLLGTITGLRSCDIAKIKLNDIDWHRGEIRIIQQKTQNSLVLPLTRDVGEALKDYILNGRISPVRTKLCDYPEVFLSVNTPCKPIIRNGIGTIYGFYRKKADLMHSTFHDLRRAVGKNMVVAEIPITTVSQVLGHADIDSTKQYISLDSKHLKECALDFSGISLKGGRTQ